MSEKESVRKVKNARGVICYAIFDARWLKNGRVDEELSLVEHADAEKVRNHRIDRR